MPYFGYCVCGDVQFSMEGEPLFTQYCHCQKCRDIAALSKNPKDKIGYGFTAAYLRDKLSILKGEDHLVVLPRNTSDLFLCANCKSLIYGISQDPAKQAGIGINVNNVVFPNGLPDSFSPDKHTFYADRIQDVADDLPKYKDTPKDQFGSGELVSD